VSNSATFSSGSPKDEKNLRTSSADLKFAYRDPPVQLCTSSRMPPFCGAVKLTLYCFMPGQLLIDAVSSLSTKRFISEIVALVFVAGGRVSSVPSGAGVATVSGSGYVGFLFGPPLIGLIAQQTSLRIALFVVVGLSFLTATLANAVGRTSHR
jgi:hypothetical protein